jgi:hypothetical protein
VHEIEHLRKDLARSLRKLTRHGPLHKLLGHLHLAHVGTGQIVFAVILALAVLIILARGKRWTFRILAFAAIGAVSYFLRDWLSPIRRMVATDLTAVTLAFIVLAARRPGRGRGGRQWRMPNRKRQRAWRAS